MDFGASIFSLLGGPGAGIDFDDGAGCADLGVTAASIDDMGIDIDLKPSLGGTPDTSSRTADVSKPAVPAVDPTEPGTAPLLQFAGEEDIDVDVESYFAYSPSLSPPESPPEFFVPHAAPLGPSKLGLSPGKPVPSVDTIDGTGSDQLSVKSEPTPHAVPQIKTTPSTPPSGTKRRHGATKGSSTQSATTDGADDEQTVKKMRRMQKNRESAMLSRQRKKAHLDGLESSNAKLREENVRLTADKENLQQKVKSLEAENTQLREQLAKHATLGSTGGLGAVSKTTLMACLLCFGLYANPMGPVTSTGSRSLSVTTREVPSLGSQFHVGRTLKSLDSRATAMMAEPLRSNANPDVTPQSGGNGHEVAVSHSDLRNHFNLSDYHPEVRSDGKPDASAGTDLVAAGSTSGMDSMQGDWTVPPVFRLRNGLTARQMRSFRKRTDTSYVFCTEVQIISAATLNEDGIPRMSVVMPAPESSPVGNNGTSSQDFSMVQVDCNVAGSKAIQLSGNSTM